MSAPTGMEQMVQMLCRWMGLDMKVLGPQVIQTMEKIQEAEKELADIKLMTKANNALLNHIYRHLEGQSDANDPIRSIVAHTNKPNT